MLRYFFTFAILALALIQMGAFTLQMITSPHRTYTVKTSSNSHKYSVCSSFGNGSHSDNIGSAVLVDRRTDAYKIHRRHTVDSDKLNDAFQK